MNRTLTILIASIALAGSVPPAMAQQGGPMSGDFMGGPPMAGGPMRGGPGAGGPSGGPGGGQGLLERADVDNDGAISLDEFLFAMGGGLGDADLDGDGRITADEIVSHMVETRVRPMAQNMVRRFDVNGDGVLTMEEIDQRQKQMFERLDRDGSGKIEASEMPRGRPGGPRR